jgi:hypothetical protein
VGQALRLQNFRSVLSDIFSGIWRALILGCSLLVGISIALATAIKMTDSSEGAGYLWALFYFPGILLCSVVHELGHAMVAWIFGWRIQLVAVADYGYLPMERRFTRVSRADRRGFGGMVVAAVPRSEGWKKRYACFAIGGPAADLIFAVTALALMSLLQSYRFGPLFGCLAALSLISSIANLIPSRGLGAGPSDGAVLLDLVRKTHPLLVTQDLWALHEQSLGGVKPVGWDIGLVKRVEAFEGSPQENLLRDQLLLNFYLSYGDLSRCRMLAERHALSAGTKSPIMMVEYAFLIALLDKDGEKAKVTLDELPGRMKGESFQYWRAFAVASYVSGDNVEAREAVAKALAFAKKGKLNPDQDDLAIMSAIEQDLQLPVIVSRAAPS